MAKKVKKAKAKKKRRINIKRTFVFLLGVYLMFSLIFSFFNLPIKNIYIHNNSFLSDQEIIEAAGISDYPPTLQNLSSMIEKKVKENTYILDAVVYKKHFTEVHIDVTENRPIFFNKTRNKTVLLNGKEVTNQFDVPTLINIVPDEKYSELIEKMADVNNDILIRISEIQYKPNEVDNGRFLLSMNDGNYVYLTLNKFSSINNYISIINDIIKKFGNKKGILYLDAGDYFDIMDD